MSGRTQRLVGIAAFILFWSAAIDPFLSSVEGGTERIPRPSTGTAFSDSVKTDPDTGLAIDDQLMLVKGQCTACHSSKLILQSHFSRDKWIERIRWMQRTQKLWDLGESEPAILAYLTKHYGPADGAFDGRREPLKKVKWHKPGN
ncbi:MAG: hypothetical protein JWP57_2091 [Spirosoma sp.]|nr:hypothetical protein [Spirosoma sp.]